MSSFVCAFICFVFGKLPFLSWTAAVFYRKKWNYDTRLPKKEFIN